MMMHRLQYKVLIPLVISGVLVMLSSCEKDITVDLPQPEIKIVIEGYITPGSPAYVFISRTAPFFAPVDSVSLVNSAEKDALVIVSDGTTSDTLVPPLASVGYFYISPNMIGEVGKTYSLTVITRAGETVTAETRIDPPVALDSIWFRRQSETDTLGWIWARLNEPPLLGNSYRWFAKRLGKDDDFIAPVGSVLEDKFFNGLSFEFAYNRGKKANSNAEDDNNDEEGFFKVGDTVVVKFASITKESFDFWRAAETQSSSNGNPFGSPAPLKSNIAGGIGIWEGFSFTLDTTIAQ